MVSMLQHIIADARGYSQHLFFGHNDFRQVWTGDRCEIHTVVAPLFLQKPITMNWAKTGSGHTRKSLSHSPKQTRRLCFIQFRREILTLDPLFGSYTSPGGVLAVSNVTVASDGTITVTNSTPGTQLVFVEANGTLVQNPHMHPFDEGDLGGAVTVVDGAGAGQYRRLVTAGRTPTIDRPFATPLDNSSVLQVGPFRGRTIFLHNRYEDGGDWQLYGNAHDWIIAKQHMARTGGIKSWGRGFSAPNFCPNIRVQIVDCVIEETNHIANWAISGNWTNASEPESPVGAGMPKSQIGNGSLVEHKTYPNIVSGSTLERTTEPARSLLVAGWLAGWLAAHLAGWLACWLAGLLACFRSPSGSSKARSVADAN